MKQKFSQYVWDYGVIAVSCVLYAFAFNCFFQANSIAMGGFTGIVQVLHHFVPVLPIGTTVFMMNVPLMIIGVRKQGWNLLFASVFATFVSSLCIDGLDLLYRFPPMDPLLASLYGGVLLGIALGLMMRKSATTGGTELAARLLKYKFHNISIGKICLVIDVLVVVVYAVTMGRMENALYGIIAMYVSSKAMDLAVYGMESAKLTIVVSDKSEEITARLMTMGLGATILQGKGAYTGGNKNVLMCAAKPNKITAIKTAVTDVDPDRSFIVVCDAKEVFGEGFGDFSLENL